MAPLPQAPGSGELQPAPLGGKLQVTPLGPSPTPGASKTLVESEVLPPVPVVCVRQIPRAFLTRTRKRLLPCGKSSHPVPGRTGEEPAAALRFPRAPIAELGFLSALAAGESGRPVPGGDRVQGGSISPLHKGQLSGAEN